MNLVEIMAGGFMVHDGREFAVASNRYPSVKVGGEYKPLGRSAASDDDIMEMLLALGGRAHAEAIGAQPTTWRVVDVALGPLQVTAARRSGVLQARVVAPPGGSVAAAASLGANTGRNPASSAQPYAPPPPRAPVAAPSVPAAAGAQRRTVSVDDIQFDLIEEPVKAPAWGHPAHVTPALVGAVANGAADDDDDDGIPAVLRGGPAAPRLEVETPVAMPAANRAPARSAPPAIATPAVPTFADAKRPAAPPDPAALGHWLAAARERGASDLHIVAARPVLMRIGGDLRPCGDVLPPALVEKMLMPHIPARLVEGFHREGSCDFAIEQPPHGRFRVNVSRQRTGLKASLRLVGLATPSLESLGLPAVIGNATHHHQGLIVVTGPTGHGKTSTLAAIVNLMNTETKHHIITVEDPIEYVHSRKKALISQREVGTHTRTFASALKASLREDPEVIVVGELRDTETVRMALSASETGHLVVASMNTPSAAKTIDRLIDLFPPADQPQVRMGLAGGLRLIVSQRLLRGADGTKVFAAAEILPGNVALWNLIRDNKTYQIPSLQQRGKAFGIVRLDDSLIELVRAGKVSLDEARSVAEAPDEISAAITGQRPVGAGKRGV